MKTRLSRRFLTCGLVSTMLLCVAADATAQRGSSRLPQAGLYHCGATFEFSAVTSSSLRLRVWQTNTPAPPESRSAYFQSGAATLLPDGVTWRYRARDVDGYCCGNNVESEFRFLSPSRFVMLRYRTWPLSGMTPVSGEGWQSVGTECAWSEGLADPAPEAPGEPAVGSFPPSPDAGVDSGARFSVISREVEIYPRANPDDRRYATEKTVIHVDDVIVTGENSLAVISFADLSTLKVEAESAVLIPSSPPEVTKLQLVAGRLWMNVKKLIRGEPIEVRSNHCTLGVKGTTFECESTADHDDVLVIEGLVTVTHRYTREERSVGAGQRLRVVRSGFAVEPSATAGAVPGGLVNLARGKAALQSSTGYGGSADRAVDGNTNGNYFAGSMTHTQEAALPEPWWQVDLGRSAQIDHVMLWNRSDCCGERLAAFWVFVSETPFPQGDAATLLRDTRIWRYQFKGGAGLQTRVPVGARGRYVRVQLSGVGPLSLAEVEVLAK